MLLPMKIDKLFCLEQPSGSSLSTSVYQQSHSHSKRMQVDVGHNKVGKGWSMKTPQWVSNTDVTMNALFDT